MNRLLLCFLFLLSFKIHAESFKDLYQVGSGASYNMIVEGAPGNNVSIYVTATEKNSLWVEYYIVSKQSLMPVQLWQQFELVRGNGSGVKVRKGYIQSATSPHPEILEEKHLKGSDIGAQTSDFLFSTFEQINKHLVNKEEVTVPAGTLKANRYKISSNGQTVEFWIAEDRTPMTLVKLISKGKKRAQNYHLELDTLLTNVAQKIDPSRAKPLSKSTRSILETKLK